MFYKNYLWLFLLFFFPFSVFAEPTNFKCGESAKNTNNLNLAYTNITLNVEWYEPIDEEPSTIESVSSYKINYLFWNKKYYAKIISLLGASDINESLRYLRSTYGSPFRSKNNIYGWINDSQIILSRRFSLNLGQIEFYCKELYLEKFDIKELQNGAKP